MVCGLKKCCSIASVGVWVAKPNPILKSPSVTFGSRASFNFKICLPDIPQLLPPPQFPFSCNSLFLSAEIVYGLLDQLTPSDDAQSDPHGYPMCNQVCPVSAWVLVPNRYCLYYLDLHFLLIHWVKSRAREASLSVLRLGWFLSARRGFPAPPYTASHLPSPTRISFRSTEFRHRFRQTLVPPMTRKRSCVGTGMYQSCFCIPPLHVHDIPPLVCVR